MPRTFEIKSIDDELTLCHEELKALGSNNRQQPFKPLTSEPANPPGISAIVNGSGKLNWQDAADMVRRLISLKTQIPATCTTSSEFAVLCLDLGLKESATGRTLYRVMMRTLEKQVELAESNAEAALKEYIDEHANDIAHTYSTTARQQNGAFHLIRCAYLLHYEPDNAKQAAAELLLALEKTYRTQIPLPSLMTILLQQRTNAAPFPLLGKIIVTYVHSFADAQGSQPQIDMGNTLAYILGWAQIDTAILDTAADNALCTMMLMFMVMSHPDFFADEDTPTDDDMLLFDRTQETPGVTPAALLAAQDQVLSSVRVDNGETIMSIVAQVQRLSRQPRHISSKMDLYDYDADEMLSEMRREHLPPGVARRKHHDAMTPIDSLHYFRNDPAQCLQYLNDNREEIFQYFRENPDDMKQYFDRIEQFEEAIHKPPPFKFKWTKLRIATAPIWIPVVAAGVVAAGAVVVGVGIAIAAVALPFVILYAIAQGNGKGI